MASSTSSSSSSPASVPLGSCQHLAHFKATYGKGQAGGGGGGLSSATSLYAGLLRSLVLPATASTRASRAHALVCHVCGQGPATW